MLHLYNSNGRKEWVDLGKGISMLMVLLFHCEEYMGTVNTGTAEIFSFFRMPFFFFLSGYVFTSDYHKFSLQRKLKQIARGIVWTYLIIASFLVVLKSFTKSDTLSDGFTGVMLGYASWFVVSLGVAQLLFATVLHFTKRLRLITLFMLASLGIGVGIKMLTDEVLPFQLDKAFFVVVFFGLGFFYRIYEHRFRRFLTWRCLLVAIAVYAALMTVEECVLGSATNNVFWNQSLVNFPMFMVYTITGITMMLILVNVVYTKHLNIVCYIGANSLLFYYFNGAVVQAWLSVYHKTGLAVNDWVVFTLLFLFVASTLLTIVWLVKRYCPIIVGDKAAFQRLFPKVKW